MTDKKSEKMTNASKPVPMKLFAAWEVDRTPSNCIPRLCTLTVTRLRVCAGVLGACEPASAVSLAVRMHSSKRTLRSNDIATPAAPGAQLDVELDLNFSLQYPHFVKRDGNKLQIMLQRRKKYKNRTILGYKTLAEGTIRMDQVLQRQMDMELELFAEPGSKGADKAAGAGSAMSNAGAGSASAAGSGGVVGIRDVGNIGVTPSTLGAPIARITITGLCSTPVDHDTKNNNTLVITDEEEEAEFSSVEENDEGGLALGYPSNRQRSYNKRNMSYSKQRNLKQKFAALLKRFKVPDELAEREAVRAGAALDNGDRDIDELIQEWESMSCGEGDDSGPEQVDTLSIGSTPKPSLRPFFSSSRSLATPGSVGNISTNMSGERGGIDRHDDNTRYSVDGARSKYLANASGKVSSTRRRQHPRSERLMHISQAMETTPWQRVDSSVQTVPYKPLSSSIADAEVMRSAGSDRINYSDRAEGSAASDCDQETQYSSSEHPVSPAVNLSSSPPKEKDEKRSRLFRTGGNLTNISSGAVSKKKQSLGTISIDQKQTSAYEATNQTHHLETRKPIGEQLCRVLPPDESVVPETLAIVLPSQALPAGTATMVISALNMAGIPTVAPPSAADINHVMLAVLNRIHKHCNLSAKAVQPVRVVLAGADTLVASTLRSYCDLWARRPPDWASYMRFYLIPMGSNTTSRHIASMDPGYAVLFSSESWSSLLDRATIEPSPIDVSDVCARITRYVKNSGPIIQLPVAEAMIAYRDKTTDEDSNQTFVPFVSDVRIGVSSMEGPSIISVDTDELNAGGTGGSPRQSPPATPAVAAVTAGQINNAMNNDALIAAAIRKHHGSDSEAQELQIDYWQAAKSVDGGRSQLNSNAAPSSGGLSTPTAPSAPPDKTTIKNAFRSLQVSRTHNSDGSVAPTFTIIYCTKEKKQKIMRLGKKKEKDRDSDSSKSQAAEGVSRLICSSKVSHNVPIRVYIDGVEWNGVKFFQLSTQWQTHVKNFPVALTGAPLAPEEMPYA